MRKIEYYISLFLLIVCYGCDDNAFLDSGPTISKTINYDFYNHLVLNDIFDIYLVQDSVNKLVIEGGENVIDQLSINQTDTIIEIDNNANMRWSRTYDKVKLSFHFTNIRKIELNEPSYIESINYITSEKLSIWALTDLFDLKLKLNTDNFFFVNVSTATGLLELTGTTRYLNNWVRGSAILDADSLVCESANVHFSSIAKAYINVTNDLSITIDDRGTVYYIGNPQEIIRKNDFKDSQLVKLD